MKKITFLTLLLITSLGFSQNLLTNGDFEAGTPGTPWYGNALNPVDDGSGSNFVNQANVGAAGNPWDVNVSQNLTLVDGETYTFTYDAYTATGTTRTIVVGIGEAPGGANGANVVTETLTDAVTTFTHTLVANYGSAATSRVIFDLGAETGFVFIDNVSLELVGGAAPTCTDGIMNGDETGVDCGGTCTACPPASELLTNGDFEAGTPGTPWYGNALNPVDDGSGSNFVNQANVGAAGNPWDVNVSQNLTLVDGETYTLTYDAYTATGTTRTIVVGIGEAPGGANGANVVTETLTDAVTTFTHTLVANYGSAATSRVIFDLGAETGFVFIDNVSLKQGTLGVADFEKVDFNVYPNPAQNDWTIKTANVKMLSIQVFDISGKNVVSVSPNRSETKIDASNLKSGLYIAQIKTESGINSIKLIKR